MERLAINLSDLDRVTPEMRINLLKGRINPSKDQVITITVKEGQTERAIPFTCELLQAALVCDIIRSHDRQAGDTEARIYIEKDGEWKKMERTAILTISGGKKLNPKYFDVEETIIVKKESKLIFKGKPAAKG